MAQVVRWAQSGSARSRNNSGPRPLVLSIDSQHHCRYRGGVRVDDDRTAEVTLPALLRAARRVYGSAVSQAQSEAGYEDMPPNGSYVIGAIDRGGSPLSEIIEQLGVSKQAAGHLVDALVSRGYLDRSPDPEDRRRLRISVTARGEDAAAVTRAAVSSSTPTCRARGAEHVAHTRATLIALLGHGRHGAEAAGSS